ncbi:MAG: hypothetical protein HKN43_09645 [Rhodothermales bacterium]|nr:hypothetical protein [Rhodothermales bacterium]
METFDLADFTIQILAEALFYDDEFGAIGNISLVDPQEKKECFIASFVPDVGSFVIEQATDWEDYDVDSDEDEIGYVLAVDSEEFGSYFTPVEAADVLLGLAEEHGFVPSITLLFEEEDLI